MVCTKLDLAQLALLVLLGQRAHDAQAVVFGDLLCLFMFICCVRFHGSIER